MRLAKIAALLLCSATVTAIACDPDAMDQAMSEICAAGVAAAQEAVDAAIPHAIAAEADHLRLALSQAQDICHHGDPALAAAQAARLSRHAGRIEARATRS
ncbi:MAG: hypothetical protein NTW56_04250 [Alphaproteobacteria bacterium]|nr:hypothetical protein [Alphaproteobacteria bacterium]